MSDVQNELSRLNKETGVVPTLGDKRVKKSATREAFESFLEIDTDELKKNIKLDFKRKLRAVIGDILIEGIGMIFHNRSASAAAKNVVSSVVRSTDNVSYRDYSSASKNGSRSAVGGKYTFSDLKYSRRVDAVDLLDAMQSVLAENGKVSVTNLYDILEDPSNLEMTDNNFGWTDLSGAYVSMDGGLYRLFLPPVVALK